MLYQFTWQQFLLAALIVILVWYLAIFLLYYRRKTTDLFSAKTKGKQSEKLRREWDEELEDGFEEESKEESLMGKPAQPEGVSSVPMEALRFAPKAADRDIQLGLIPDVLEELKSIFHILEKEDGTKEDFISLFALVSSKYPKIKGTPNQQALNDHIRENLPFEISQEELDRLWK